MKNNKKVLFFALILMCIFLVSCGDPIENADKLIEEWNDCHLNGYTYESTLTKVDGEDYYFVVMRVFDSNSLSDQGKILMSLSSIGEGAINSITPDLEKCLNGSNKKLGISLYDAFGDLSLIYYNGEIIQS